MWIFTKYGFFSIACAQAEGGGTDTDLLMIRAREHEHLENLRFRFTDLANYEITQSLHTDYRYRIIVPKSEWISVLAKMADEQAWSSFKSEVAKYRGSYDQPYLKALDQVWGSMRSLQQIPTPEISEIHRSLIEELLGYLPYFERVCRWEKPTQPEDVLYLKGVESDGVDRTTGGEPNDIAVIYEELPVYPKEVVAFFDSIPLAFMDQQYPTKRVDKWLVDPDFIQKASYQQARTVLTWICRSEHMCHGEWNAQIHNGNLVKTLRRLKELMRR